MATLDAYIVIENNPYFLRTEGKEYRVIDIYVDEQKANECKEFIEQQVIDNKGLALPIADGSDEIFDLRNSIQRANSFVSCEIIKKPIHR